jgi:molecular chaperone GrpE
MGGRGVLNSEEQHRREEELSRDGSLPEGESGHGGESLSQEDPESLEEMGGEDPGAVPETEPEVEEEELKGDPGEETEITVREEIQLLTEELESARKERDEYLDNARRMKAELENSRRRQEKERARFVQLASERLMKELLPVLDNLDRALEVEGDIREGIRATRDQLFSVLGQEGLTPVASDGQSFDPNVHEAVMSQPSDEHEEDTILQTLERGYVLNGKPIRPAKVIVAKQV